ncbi:MAG: site-2 protease family protein [Planctomycetes bacterium]|nr:site-2 protease family protein [Planctomycetota bacterium]
MHAALLGLAGGLAASEMPVWLLNTLMFLKVLVGFSIIIFVHELGHFLAAKWVGIRVDRFAVGFGYRLCGWRKGEGLTFGNRPNYSPEELDAKQYGETDYCFKALPLGGYVKMLGQDDIIIDEKTGEVQMSDDPRSFTNHSVGHRLVVVSAGVVFNVLFAAILLMCVFLMGKRMDAPVIAEVEPDGPAARAGLLPGDHIVTIDGRSIYSFKDIIVSWVLADGPIHFGVERGGQRLPDEIVVQPEFNEEVGLQTIGISPMPMQTTELAAAGEPVGDLPAPRAGDRITHVNGEPVQNAIDVLVTVARSRGKVLEYTVIRPDPDKPQAEPEIVTCYQRAMLSVWPSGEPGEGADSLDERNILGFCQRRVVAGVTAGSPADKAGFKLGDVIVQWDTIGSPLHSEILANIETHDGKPTPVLVERDGKTMELSVTPQRSVQIFGSAPPRVGLAFARGEEWRPIVGYVAPGTPAAALHLPRGAELLEIAGRAVDDWFDVVEALKEYAGQTVAVKYRSGTDEAVGQMAVPGSMINELNLPPVARIVAIDGQETVTLEDGSKARLILSDAIRELLRQKVTQTVTVRYAPDLASTEILEQQYTVRADQLDPWQMRVQYVVDPQAFAPMVTIVNAGGNPFKALAMGTRETGYFLLQVYQVLRNLFKRTVPVRQVSGPVGIISHAIGQAKKGMPELLFFLAFLSANLAVLNFLPLPVVDGGLVVFLLIEKIKGSPLSMKTQMISTIVGLVGIGLFILFITIQDVSKLFN